MPKNLTDDATRSLINAMMIAWAVAHDDHREEFFILLFHDDGIYWEAYINGTWRCQTIPYNYERLRGIHRLYVLCIIASEREEAPIMAAPLTTSAYSRTVTIK